MNAEVGGIVVTVGGTVEVVGTEGGGDVGGFVGKALSCGGNPGLGAIGAGVATGAGAFGSVLSGGGAGIVGLGWAISGAGGIEGTVVPGSGGCGGGGAKKPLGCCGAVPKMPVPGGVVGVWPPKDPGAPP